MRLTLPPLQINPDDPFNKDDDIFERREFAERLAKLIKNVEDDNLVISLNAQWGEGKTTFVKMFEAYLNQDNATSIYFDAFAHDYVDDAFTAISGEIYTKVSVKIPDKEPDNKFSELVKNFLIGSIKLGTKIAINKLGIDKEDIGMLLESASNGISKIVETKIEKYNEHKESLKNFKKELEKLAEALKKEQRQKLEKLAITANPNANLDDIKPYPLIFIVDELDRCKPTYALDVIEKIKHFFSVKNVVFILVMNKQQMENSIKSVYGEGIDASTYLQKFVNLECVLPKQTENIDNTDRYCDYMKEQHGLIWTNNIKLDILQDVLKVISKIGEFSLRDIEKCYLYFVLYYLVLEKTAQIQPLLVAFLITLKVKDFPVYEKLKNNTITHEELSLTSEFYKKMKDKISKSNLARHYQARRVHSEYFILSHWIEACLNPDPNKQGNIESELALSLQTYGSTAKKIIPDICNKIDSFEFID